MELQGRKILVVGMARTGVATVKFLAPRGALVTATDTTLTWEDNAETCCERTEWACDSTLTC